MPIYAYRCEHCGHAKDVLQKVSDPVLTVCPACGEPTFRKQVTAAGFQLKGSGWYVTDFRGDKPAKRGDTAEATEGKPADGKPAEGAGGDSTAPAGKDNGSGAAAVNGKPANEPARDKPAAAPAAATPAAAPPSAAPPSSGTGSGSR